MKDNQITPARVKVSASKSYTLTDLTDLAQKYVDTLPPLARELTTELAISGLLAWLGKKEREGNERST